MERKVRNEPEPWAGLRKSLVDLLETEKERRMKNKRKSIEEILEMDTIEAWRTTLEQLPRKKLPEDKYSALLNLCDHPYMVADDTDQALSLLSMLHDTFKERYDHGVGNQKQNATLSYMAQVNFTYLLDVVSGGMQ